MAIGKSKVKINLKKLNLNIGSHKIIENGKISPSYKESDVAEYMRSLEIIVESKENQVLLLIKKAYSVL